MQRCLNFLCLIIFVYSLTQFHVLAQNIPFDNVLQSYDWRFYQQKRLQSEFSVDNETIKQYFPMERVVHHTLQLYQQLFSVEFVEVPKTDAHHRCWHEDVQQYNVYDATSKDELGTVR